MAIIGSFQEDLDIYLADYKGRSGASKQSEKDLSGIGSIAKGLLDNGKMYSFEYFTPDETFYYTYPLVLNLYGDAYQHPYPCILICLEYSIPSLEMPVLMKGKAKDYNDRR